MEFNPGKYEVLHFVRSNLRGKYKINGRTLNSIDYTRGCGINVHHSPKLATQEDSGKKGLQFQLWH